MSKDFHAYIERFNHVTHKWEAVLLYKKLAKNNNGAASFQEIPFIDGGWSEAAYILVESESDLDLPPFNGAIPIEISSLSPEVAAACSEFLEQGENGTYKAAAGCFGFCTANLADVQIYVLLNPRTQNAATNNNPLFPLVQKALNYILICSDELVHNLSDYRLVYWADC